MAYTAYSIRGSTPPRLLGGSPIRAADVSERIAVFQRRLLEPANHRVCQINKQDRPQQEKQRCKDDIQSGSRTEPHLLGVDINRCPAEPNRGEHHQQAPTTRALVCKSTPAADPTMNPRTAGKRRSPLSSLGEFPGPAFAFLA
jgi:hypothetical protein